MQADIERAVWKAIDAILVMAKEVTAVADAMAALEPSVFLSNTLTSSQNKCNTGRLYETELAVDYAWEGTAPLHLTIYLLQRLLCPACKTSFTAPSPGAGLSCTVDDSQDSLKAGTVDANASANAMVAGMRFEYGVPH